MLYSPRTAESSLWKWIKANTARLRDLHLCRVENGASDPGYPDVEGCWAGVCFHIELKTCARPARPGTKLDLRHLTQEQCMWLRRRVYVGGRAFLIVRVGSGADALHYMVPGGEKPFAIKNGVTEGRLMELSLCESRVDPEQLMTRAATWQPRRALGSAAQ